jgi:peptidoglycan/xylan/chitin deacetylase (PgdA/CDA1 family)
MGTFVVATYHEIEDSATSPYILPWSGFRRQLMQLQELGIRAVGFSDVERAAEHGDNPPPFVVTFDDGHGSTVQACTEMAERGMRATAFVTPKFCLERPDFMQPSDLRALQKVADVGAHGYSHQPLTKLGDAELEAELHDSKAWLEDVLGSPVTYMSLPQGFANRRVLKACAAAGFRLVGNSVEWWNDSATAHATGLVNRIALRRGWSEEDFDAIVRRSTSFYLRRRLRGAALEVPKTLLSEAALAKLVRLWRAV